MDYIANCIVCYNNENEVKEYLNCLEQQNDCEQLLIEIVVNKSNCSHEQLSNLFSSEKMSIEILYPPQNLGYINGLSYGFKNIPLRIRDSVRWYIYSNTDITFNTDMLVKHLLEVKYETDTWLIGPAIYQNGSNLNMNPYVINRYSREGLLLRELCLRSRILSKLMTLRNRSNNTNKPEYPSMKTYAIHGSFMILHPELARIVSEIEWELLYGEENLLAEIAYKNEKTSFYDSEISINHMAGTVTTSLGDKRLRRIKANSIKRIIKDYY